MNSSAHALHPEAWSTSPNTLLDLSGSLSQWLLRAIKRFFPSLLAWFDRKNSSDWSKSLVLESIRKKMRNPEYLDTDLALRDFETLIFIVYQDTLTRWMTEAGIYRTKRELLRLSLYLRSLSNKSWLIAKRKSGFSAFSHWMEAVFIYLENDPQPTIAGIKDLLSHDALEDPMFDNPRNRTRRWGDETRFMRALERHAGHATLTTVKYLTKPEPTIVHLRLAGHDPEATDIPTPQIKEAAEHARNIDYLRSIWALPEREFLKKLADSLSNIRNVDAFCVLEEAESPRREKGRKKILRKCTEALHYLVPRAAEVAPQYFVQLVSEIDSIVREYQLDLDLGEYWVNSPLFTEAMRKSEQLGLHFVKTGPKIISRNVYVARYAYEARRFKF